MKLETHLLPNSFEILTPAVVPYGTRYKTNCSSTGYSCSYVTFTMVAAADRNCFTKI